MPKSMTKNKNEVWMAGSTWSSRNLELEMGDYLFDSVRTENKIWLSQKSKYLLIQATTSFHYWFLNISLIFSKNSIFYSPRSCEVLINQLSTLFCLGFLDR